MLKFIRRNASGAWVKAMFLAIVAVFLFWGIGAGIGGGTKTPYVARVNGERIEEVDFQRAHNNLMKLYQDIYKDNFKPELLQGLDLKGKAVDQLIRVSLLRQEAERIGLRVGETEVRDAIVNLKSFQEDGRFNKDLYLRALKYNRLTPGEFEDSEREQILVNKMQEIILAGVHVSEPEARERFHFENEKVVLKFVKLDGKQFVSQVTPTDDDLKSYYDKHQDALREPDKVKIEYVMYLPEMFEKKVDVPDADVQRYYDEHQADYSKPERVHARHILVKAAEDATPEVKAEARKKAEALLAKAKAGEDFAALAEKNSEDTGSAPQGGDLGFFGRGQMVPPFEAVAFTLSPGSISELVETTFGFHIIKVEAKEEAHAQPLAEVREEIVPKLAHDKARELAHAQANTDQAKVSGGATLAAVAEAASQMVVSPAPFSKTDSIEKLGRTPLNDAAFSLAVNAVGPVVDTPRGFVVFRVTEKIAAHVPDLAAIRPKVEDSVRKEQADVLAKSKAEAFLAEVQKTNIDSAAQAAGYSVEESGPSSRADGLVQKLGVAPDLMRDAFLLTTEKPVAPAVYSVSGDYVVAALKERVAADDEQFKSLKDTRIKQAEDRRKQQTMEEFLNYLKARAQVELNQDYLASIPETGRPMDAGRRR